MNKGERFQSERLKKQQYKKEYARALESNVVPEDWRSAVTVPLYKDRGERTEFQNYRGTSLVRVVGKIDAGILVDSL